MEDFGLSSSLGIKQPSQFESSRLAIAVGKCRDLFLRFTRK